MRNEQNFQEICFFSNSPTCFLVRFWTWLRYGESQCPGVLGSPVWGLPQHGSVYNRPVHQLRPGQVGAAQRDRPAPATRHGGNGEAAAATCTMGVQLHCPLCPWESQGCPGDPLVLATLGRKALLSMWDCLSVTEKNVDRLTGENQKTLRNISQLLASCPS